MSISIYFFLEMLVKMAAMGVWADVDPPSRAYMSDSWNVLDFVIVLCGMIDLLGIGGAGLTLLRVLRVLRPLRAINRLPGLRVLVTLVFETLPMLGSVIALCSFIFFVFSILGLQLWKGMFRQRCFSSVADFWELEGELPWSPYLCSMDTDAGMHTCNASPDD